MLDHPGLEAVRSLLEHHELWLLTSVSRKAPGTRPDQGDRISRSNTGLSICMSVPTAKN